MRHLNNFKRFSVLLEKYQVEPIGENLYSQETVPDLPFKEGVSGEKENFLKKIKYIAKKLGIKPEWLMIAIHNESGFDPHISNKISNATGLIQFMPSTIVKYLHPDTKNTMTIEDLKRMSAIDQLDIVYEYLKQAKKGVGMTESQEMQRAGDFFSLIFYPKLVKSPDSFQFPDNVVRDNKGLFNRIGGTTKAAYYKYCDRIVQDPTGVAKSIDNFENEGYFGKDSGANVGDFDAIEKAIADGLVDLAGRAIDSAMG